MLAALEDPIWQMVAILNGTVEGSELVAVLSAFVDESGTGDEPNVMLAAIVSDIGGWANFNGEWQSALDDNGLDYAHYTDMRRGRGQYAGWSMDKKQEFSWRCYRIMKQHCYFGFTISLNKQLYRERYRELCKRDRISPDSAYALCAREVFGYAVVRAHQHLGYSGPMNFIFESGHTNSANAADVFNDLKEHSEIGERLGFFALDDKKKLKPLQGADHIAHQGRRSEQEALQDGGILTVPVSAYEENFESVNEDGCPMFYFGINEEKLDYYHSQHLVLRRIRNRKKRDK